MRCVVKTLFMVASLLLASGCATHALWEEGQFARFHEPTTPSNLQLFKAGEKQQFLIVYDEGTDADNSQRRRAFWADLNRPLPVAPYRPRFVPLKTADASPPIPLLNAPK